MTDYKELLAQRDALEQQIAAARTAEVTEILKEIRGLIADFGLASEDIFPNTQTARTSKNKGVPKYRDPVTGKTWTGRGKAPLWIKEKDRDQFEINKS